MKTDAIAVRQHSAKVRKYVTGLWVASTTLVVLERFSAATIAAFRSHFASAEVTQLACQAVSAVPELLFLLGLWWVREALSAFSRGEWFASPIARMLDRVGIVLVCGAFVRIFLVPGACRLLGLDSGYWIAFDASALVLGAIGLALRAIASVLRRASAIQSELDEIF
ncbi:MAG TPA: DUF2975 domain-containing protein [Thermoanaerobaculia bacterium]|jgi:hypothetical protein